MKDVEVAAKKEATEGVSDFILLGHLKCGV